MQVGIDIIVFALGFFVGIGVMLIKLRMSSGSAQTKELLAQERSLWSMPKDREQWFKGHKERYGIPSFDPSKSHQENKKIQNAALKKLTPEQKIGFEKEFYDKVYKEQGEKQFK